MAALTLAVGTAVLCVATADPAQAAAVDGCGVLRQAGPGGYAPSQRRSYRLGLQAHRPVALRSGPSPTARVVARFKPVTSLENPTVFSAMASRCVAGVPWVKVLYPGRPNGKTGWLRHADAIADRLTRRVVVDVSDRRLRAYNGTRLVYTFPVAVGAPGTETPHGRFYVAEKVVSRPPDGFLGPRILVTSAFSRTLNEYAGGKGQVAMHGTSARSSIGTAASHGCVRNYNENILRLDAFLPTGAPVVIRA